MDKTKKSTFSALIVRYFCNMISDEAISEHVFFFFLLKTYTNITLTPRTVHQHGLVTLEIVHLNYLDIVNYLFILWILMNEHILKC